MKQKYLKPAIMVCLIQARHHILEASRSVGVSSDDYSNGTILSRRGGSSDWDDEEE